MSRAMNVWSGQFFCFVQFKQFGTCLISVFKIIYFFQIASTLRSCTELSWAWAPGCLGSMISTSTNASRCPCCCAGCGEFTCTGELAREKVHCSLSFPPCLLSVCSLELLSSFSWKSSFGSSPAFSAMKTALGLRRCFPSGWGISHFLWASAFTTQGAWLMCLACAVWHPGSPFRLTAQGSQLPTAFPSTVCLLKEPPKRGAQLHWYLHMQTYLPYPQKETWSHPCIYSFLYVFSFLKK